MADRVEAILEGMVGELDELSRLQLFSASEVRALVSRRRDFEYKLHRRKPVRSDFLRAIQYELSFDSLRRHRKDKIAPDVKGVSDFATVRRIFFLFQRALRKFPNDIALWNQYLNYAIRIKSSRALNQAFAR